MGKPNIFELAGYSKEESQRLIGICAVSGQDASTLLQVLRGLEVIVNTAININDL